MPFFTRNFFGVCLVALAYALKQKVAGHARNANVTRDAKKAILGTIFALFGILVDVVTPFALGAHLQVDAREAPAGTLETASRVRRILEEARAALLTLVYGASGTVREDIAHWNFRSKLPKAGIFQDAFTLRAQDLVAVRGTVAFWL